MKQGVCVDKICISSNVWNLSCSILQIQYQVSSKTVSISEESIPDMLGNVDVLYKKYLVFCLKFDLPSRKLTKDNQVMKWLLWALLIISWDLTLCLCWLQNKGDTACLGFEMFRNAWVLRRGGIAWVLRRGGKLLLKYQTLWFTSHRPCWRSWFDLILPQWMINKRHVNLFSLPISSVYIEWWFISALVLYCVKKLETYVYICISEPKRKRRSRNLSTNTYLIPLSILRSKQIFFSNSEHCMLIS